VSPNSTSSLEFNDKKTAEDIIGVAEFLGQQEEMVDMMLISQSDSFPTIDFRVYNCSNIRFRVDLVEVWM